MFLLYNMYDRVENISQIIEMQFKFRKNNKDGLKINWKMRIKQKKRQ